MPGFSRVCSLPCELRLITSGRIALHIRQFTSTCCYQDQPTESKGDHLDVSELLSKPTWSVSSLLPKPDDASKSPQVTKKQLHHLLRLSALPPPKDAKEEERMLSTLSSQLHFVKEIQSVDTSGVEPLRSLRDESQVGEQEAELGLDAMKDALENEEVRGQYHRRLRRKRQDSQERIDDEAKWDVLSTADRKVGRFFVVEGGKEG